MFVCLVNSSWCWFILIILIYIPFWHSRHLDKFDVSGTCTREIIYFAASPLLIPPPIIIEAGIFTALTMMMYQLNALCRNCVLSFEKLSPKTKLWARAAEKYLETNTQRICSTHIEQCIIDWNRLRILLFIPEMPCLIQNFHHYWKISIQPKFSMREVSCKNQTKESAAQLWRIFFNSWDFSWPTWLEFICSKRAWCFKHHHLSLLNWVCSPSAQFHWDLTKFVWQWISRDGSKCRGPFQRADKSQTEITQLKTSASALLINERSFSVVVGLFQ